MNLSNNLPEVPASVPRIKRIISPAQDGLLDATSHYDAAELAEALKWVQRIAAGSVAGGATADAERKLGLVGNLTAWLTDVELESRGLVEFDGQVMRFADLPRA